MYEVISIGFCPEDARLIIKTKDCASGVERYNNIVFFQVLAYGFDDIGRKNIIDEIADNPVLYFLNWYYSDRNPQKQFMLAYGLPLAFTDKTSAVKAADGKYIYYEINAYIGMDGFVIAQEMKME